MTDVLVCSQKSAHSQIKGSRRAFTLIELLVVIAIIAILAVVVVLTLNPAELLRQSRDSNRLSDLATINSAIGLYSTDQSGATSFSLGSASTTYISVPDPTATSTAGDQCQGLNLPSLPSGDSYHCAASSTYKNVNGTGWIPVNLQNISSGAPIGTFPTDPTNQTSTNLFYTYTTNGTQFMVTAILESQKYKLQYASNPPIAGYPEVEALGNNLSLSELYNPSGLVGWWPLNEGSGSSTIDASGNGDGGTWVGGAAGTNGTYYTTGKVGAYAGDFDGSSTYITTANNAILGPTTALTLSVWINTRNSVAPWAMIMNKTSASGAVGYELGFNYIYANIAFTLDISGTQESLGGVSAVTNNKWYLVTATYDGSVMDLYMNGVLNASATYPGAIVTAPNGNEFGGRNGAGILFPGSMNDARVYSRVLSASEIQALYNAEK